MMKSIQYKATQTVEVADKGVPEIAAGEVLIKVAYAGVCGSDMIIYQGMHPRAKAPLVMGHEFSGTVVKGHSSFAAWHAGHGLSAGQLRCLRPM
jgi:(R,R)-butanediol dehydrogenase/meso-butanediol dehydrogenase/diacetyl reductase